MPEHFDPLYEWLGIPPKDQPPNHYRLLGIELFESNLNVIERAADRQMSHVRTYQSGKHGRDSQDLLNKLSAAKVCLLQPAKKAEYDASLRADRRTSDSSSSVEIPADLSSLMPKAVAMLPAAAPSLHDSSVREIVTVVEKPRRKVQKTENTALVIGIVVAVVTLIGGVGAWLVISSQKRGGPEPAGKPPESAPQVAANSAAPPAESSSPKTPATVPSEATNPATVPAPASTSVVPSNSSPPLSTAATTPPPVRIEIKPYDEVAQRPQDPPPRDSWPAPDDALRQRFSNAKGLVQEKFALCQTMPFAEFVELAQPLREIGFRPNRVRPFVSDSKVLVSAVWTRDGKPWRLVSGVSRAELERAHATLDGEGFYPIDVSGFAGAGDLYTGLWVKLNSAIPSRLVVGRTTAEFAQELRSSNNWSLRSFWRFVDSQGEHRVCGIFTKPTARPAWSSFDGTYAVFARQIAKGLPIDVGHYRLGKGMRLCGIVLTDDKRPFKESHGGTVDEHLQRCEEFIREGFFPLAISVAERNEDNKLEGASIWVAPTVGSFPEIKEGGATPSVASVPPATTPSTITPPNVREKTPTPTKEAIDAALAKSREVLKSKFAANNTPLKQMPFSAELLTSAREETDATNKYALLLLARDVAIDAGDAWAAARALDELAFTFDTDIWPLRSELVEKVGPKTKTDVARRALAEVALTLFHQAVMEEKFDIAEKFLGPARRFKDLARVVAARGKALVPMRKLSEAAAQAEVQLEQMPNDADAHLTLGRFLCFVKEDWPQGLAHLAQGSDPALADLAKKDLANPFDTTSKNQLAEAWASWASKSTADEDVAVAWQRAQRWLDNSGQERRPRAKPKNKPNGELESTIIAKLAETGSFISYWRGYDHAPGEVLRLEGHASDVSAVAASRSGRWIVSGSHDDTIRVWDLTTGVELSRMPSTVDDVVSLALLPDEQTVVFAGSRNKVISANLVTRADLGGFDVDSSVRELLVSADGRRMMQSRSGQQRNLFVSEVTGGQPVALPVPNSIRAIGLGRSGTTAACADENNMIHLWDLRKPAAPATLTGYASYLADVAISPNEQLVAGCYSEGIVVWDLQKRQESLRVSLPRGGQRIAFTFDSRRLVVSSNTTDVTVVDVAKGSVIKTLTAQDSSSGSCHTLAVFNDCRGAVTAGNDGVIHLWRLPD